MRASASGSSSGWVCNLDNQPLAAEFQSCPAGGLNEGGHSRRMAGIDNHRQERMCPHGGNYIQVKYVARILTRGEGLDAPFAQNDIHVALLGDVFGCTQPFDKAGGHSSF